MASSTYRCPHAPNGDAGTSNSGHNTCCYTSTEGQQDRVLPALTVPGCCTMLNVNNSWFMVPLFQPSISLQHRAYFVVHEVVQNRPFQNKSHSLQIILIVSTTQSVELTADLCVNIAKNTSSGGALGHPTYLFLDEVVHGHPSPRRRQV